MELKAEDLRDALRPDVEGEKTILIRMTPGKRPDVTFTGAWTGKYIKGAIDSIAKAYRIARRRLILPSPKVAETQTQPMAVGGKNG